MNTIDGASMTRPETDLRAADPDAVMARHHIVSGVGNHCDACGHEWTQTAPRCPAYVDALRRQAVGGSNEGGKRTSLAGLDSAALLRIADEHSGDHRCQRCGFTYSAEVRSCPAYRRVRAVLEARGALPFTSEGTSASCAGKGSGWNASTRAKWNIPAWRNAMSACTRCPFFEQCRADLDAQLATGTRPDGQIVAAVFFPPDGGEPVTLAEIANYGHRRRDRTSGRVLNHPREVGSAA